MKHSTKFLDLLYWLLMVALTACEGAGGGSRDDEMSAEWPIFRGSPSLCGYTDCALPETPTLLWSTTTQTRTVSSPIVHHSKVYMLNRKGELRGYTLEGDSCAYYDLGTPVEASFLACDSVLYVGRIDGFVSALGITETESSSDSIQPLWEFETLGQISGSPNMVGDNLLIGSYDNCMYTVQARTGQKMGQTETGYYINGAAAVWDGYMIFGGCDAWVRVACIATGEVTDSLQLDSYMPGSPAILGGTACVCDYNGNVYELSLDKGRITDHKKLFAADTSNEGWDGGVVSMPALTATDVYIFTDDRHLSCIDRFSGQVRWRKMLRGMAGECAPLVARDKVLVCTKDGHVSILDTKEGNELWHFEAGEQIVASPAIVRGRFFVQTTRGTLFCFVNAG